MTAAPADSSGIDGGLIRLGDILGAVVQILDPAIDGFGHGVCMLRGAEDVADKRNGLREIRGVEGVAIDADHGQAGLLGQIFHGYRVGILIEYHIGVKLHQRLGIVGVAAAAGGHGAAGGEVLAVGIGVGHAGISAQFHLCGANDAVNAACVDDQSGSTAQGSTGFDLGRDFHLTSEDIGDGTGLGSFRRGGAAADGQQGDRHHNGQKQGQQSSLFFHFCFLLFFIQTSFEGLYASIGRRACAP